MRSSTRRRTIGVLLGTSLAAGPVLADCGPQALGTSRTLALKRESAAYGRAQHRALPLEAGEVVITFDDGPRSESTPRVLKALQEQCVLATFFMNGDPLVRNGELAQRVRGEGHSVAQGITVMSVDAGIDDWLPEQTPQMLADRLVDRLQRSGGGIVLLHDAQDQTAQALQLLLDTLKERGYRVVHLKWEGS